MNLSRWLVRKFLPQFEQYSGGWLFRFWKLFENDQFDGWGCLETELFHAGRYECLVMLLDLMLVSHPEFHIDSQL